MSDDKTVIIFPNMENEDDKTQISGSFSTPSAFQNKSVANQYADIPNIPFSRSGRSEQPFLNMLRSLYSEVYSIEQKNQQSDIYSIKRKLIQIMDQHTQTLAEYGYENTHIMVVRYILSTFIDELLGKKDWTDGEAWANHSLLGHYYQETYGGEKFFHLLEQFVQEPSKYIQHMKLIYACISLGYKGRYSLSNNSDVQIESIRQELYARIINFDQGNDKFYHDHPASTKKHKLVLHIPYKFFIAGGILIMMLVYIIFTGMVDQNETELIQQIEQKHSMAKAPKGEAQKETGTAIKK